MSKLTSLVVVTALAISALIANSAPARAAGPAPAANSAAAAPQYLLGTTLVLKSPAQLTAPPGGYWADLLPVEYRFGVSSIVDAINAARKARGEKVMIDVTKYPINPGGEAQVNKAWEYTIDFLGMQPADIDAALAKYPLTGPCAGLAREYREINTGYYNGDTTGADLVLDVLGRQITLKTSDNFAAMREQLLGALKAIFGDSATYDINISVYQSANSADVNFSVSVSVYLNGAQPQAAEGEGAG